MTVTVSWDKDCDPTFKQRYEHIFPAWINEPSHHIKLPEGIVFDHAHVLNGLHSTSSKADPDASPHSTITLTNPDLRERGAFYTLHWRPTGSSKILANPDTIARKEAARAAKKEKQARKQAKRAAEAAKQRGGPSGTQGQGSQGKQQGKASGGGKGQASGGGKGQGSGSGSGSGGGEAKGGGSSSSSVPAGARKTTK